MKKIIKFTAVITASLLIGCTPLESKKQFEKHVVVKVERDNHSNSVHPIDPMYKITLEDSSKFSSTKPWKVGDTVLYVIFVKASIPEKYK